MNKFDEVYDIRRARWNEIPVIMDFINKYWRKGHIIATDRKLFEYEFTQNNKVNFIIALKKQTGTLEAIFGFIRCSNTDDSSKKDIWGSFWKVNSQYGGGDKRKLTGH